ncbi:FAD/NAD(P)-binding domain-containing protein [Xylaria acuta]|nr:FAD/NAD(P)-binding domain-containing protein [Xylaria acuta]
MDPIREEAIYDERHVKVVCIGAGASGICLAYKLHRSLRHFPLTVYEKNPGLGGTWYENRYPACACDVPSHNYVYSFELKADFTSVYAGSDEIQKYFKGFVLKHNHLKYFRLSHLVKSTLWHEGNGQWEVEIEDLVTGEVVHDRCHILIHACGYVNKPSWPKIPGLRNYQGTYIYSADCDTKELDKFARELETVLKLRQDNERTMNSIFNERALILLESKMKGILENKKPEEHLIPEFEVGCKRVIPSGFKYLKSLEQQNIIAVHSGVESFTSSGVVSANGRAYTRDMIICATEGRNLQTEWAEFIIGYMGAGAPEFPNMLTFLEPYSPVSNGPTLITIEAQADYVCTFLDRYQTQPSIHSIASKKPAYTDFVARAAGFMGKAVWSANCRNSYNNHTVRGRIPTTWPGSTLHYLEALREPRLEDWGFKYGTNRFSWLSDGISQTEWDPTADLGYYIRQDDNSVRGSRWERNAAANKSGAMPPRELHRQAKLAIEAVSENIKG